jgi:putative tryptophan/tyrosine transport system substrate-binding protein
MRRREFITLLGSAAAVWPIAAEGQQPPMPVVGYLSVGSPRFDSMRLAAFRQGLEKLGYVEGHNLAGEYRWADGQHDRLPGLAAELVGRSVTVIATIGGLAPTLAAKAATDSIPIVFITSGDPIRHGLVASLSRPGGNLTGVSNLAGVAIAKQLEALHQTVPNAVLIGVLADPTSPNVEFYIRDVQAAAQTLGKRLLIVEAAAESEIEKAFATLVEQRAAALLIPSEALFNSLPDQLVALAARHALPAIYAYSDFAKIGGLMSYGVSFTDPFRQAGVLTGRILKGEKPADLPVMQGTKVELIVNLKTAKTLGLTMPTALLVRADEVIE